MIEGKGHLTVQKVNGKPGRFLIYIPVDVARDSAFPLEDGPVTVYIDDRVVVVKGSP